MLQKCIQSGKGGFEKQQTGVRFVRRNLMLHFFLALTGTIFVGLSAGCDEMASETTDGVEVIVAQGRILRPAPMANIKVGFLYSGSVSDVGTSGAHEQARKALESSGISTLVRDNVPSNEAALAAVDEMINVGCNVIVGTAYQLMDCLYEAARRHPDVQFLHYGGYKTRPNLSVFFGRAYEARYLTGMVAGLMTSSNIVGYVAAMPVPEVIRGLNAFTLGVLEVNPRAQVRVAWTNAWENPVLERQTALALINIGADVLAQHQGSPAVQAAAEEREVYSIGYNADMSSFAPHAQLTAAVFHWHVFYKGVIEQLQHGVFRQDMFWLSMADGVVDIAPYGEAVPEAVRVRVDKRKREILSGEFTVFSGPVYDQSGLRRIPAGQTIDARELLGMIWLAEGVAGAVE